MNCGLLLPEASVLVVDGDDVTVQIAKRKCQSEGSLEWSGDDLDAVRR